MANNPTQEFPVRLVRNPNKRFSVFNFNKHKINFKTCGTVKMERENNLKQYKLSHDVDTMPKFGAGSEYGREQHEEARRRKYGIYRAKYNPDDQPWLMKTGAGKTAKQYKGVKEGGVLENSSYFLFMQKPDKSFDAIPLDEWYSFTQTVKYNFLSAEEAEEEYNRRHKVVNMFNVMLQKKLRKDDDDTGAGEDTEAKDKKGKKSSNLLISDMDEWGDNEEGGSDGGGSGDEDKQEKKKESKRGKQKKAKESGDEEDDDLSEGDGVEDGREVDYMSDTESDDDDPYEDVRNRGDEEDGYREKGVDQELKQLEEEAEEEEEEAKEEAGKNADEEGEEGDQEGNSKQGKMADKGRELSSSSSSDSDSDSDPETANFTSALFMQKSKPGELASSSKSALDTIRGDTTGSSRPSTPSGRPGTPSTDSGKKRKLEAGESSTSQPAAPAAKKVKVVEEGSDTTSRQALPSSEQVIEESVRRYLSRRPMSVPDLLKKLKKSKSESMSVSTFSQLVQRAIKKLNPTKVKVGDQQCLYIQSQSQ